MAPGFGLDMHAFLSSPLLYSYLSHYSPPVLDFGWRLQTAGPMSLVWASHIAARADRMLNSTQSINLLCLSACLAVFGLEGNSRGFPETSGSQVACSPSGGLLPDCLWQPSWIPYSLLNTTVMDEKCHPFHQYQRYCLKRVNCVQHVKRHHMSQIALC